MPGILLQIENLRQAASQEVAESSAFDVTYLCAVEVREPVREAIAETHVTIISGTLGWFWDSNKEK